jgi:DNA-binding Lrp family transcriptional regulator
MSAQVQLSSVDVRILGLLQNDARMTNRSLAQAVGIAPSTCLERVQRLRDAGVIVGSAIRVDPNALGLPVQAFLFIRVRPHRRALVEPFIAHARAQPETRAVYHLTGPDDYLVQVAAASVDALQRLVLDEFTARPEVVSVHTTLIFQHWDAGPLLPPAAAT